MKKIVAICKKCAGKRYLDHNGLCKKCRKGEK